MPGYDVGIVGAGVHGASAAFHLAHRDLRVVVYERGVPTGGPTGLSSAACRAYYTNPLLARIAHESLQMFADFATHTGGTADFHRTGALFVHPPEDAASVQQTAGLLHEIGIRVETLSADQLAAAVPGIAAPEGTIGVWEQDAGYADPVATTESLLKRARDQGAQLRRNTRVVGIEPGTPVAVQHDGGKDTVDRLLVAAGPWTAPLLTSAGVDLPLYAERHVVARCGLPPDVDLPFLFADIAGGYYCKPESAGQFLMGALTPAQRVEPDEPIAGIRNDESAELVAALSRRLPGMREATLLGGWSSLYDVSPDWQPVIGEVAEHVFVDTGTSGHGFKLAPALGAYVANLVIGEQPHPHMAQFHPSRFHTGQLLASGYGRARIIG